MKTLRKTYQDGKSITFADPTDYRNTVRIVSTRAPKKIANHNLLNVRNEIIANFMLPVANPVGSTDPVSEERGSIRISFSGSTLNSAAVLSLLHDAFVWAETLEADLAAGFVPMDAVLVVN